MLMIHHYHYDIIPIKHNSPIGWPFPFCPAALICICPFPFSFHISTHSTLFSCCVLNCTPCHVATECPSWPSISSTERRGGLYAIILNWGPFGIFSYKSFNSHRIEILRIYFDQTIMCLSSLRLFLFSFPPLLIQGKWLLVTVLRTNCHTRFVGSIIMV